MRKGCGLSNDDFIEAWNAAESLPAFCELTGYMMLRASNRASRLRSSGMDLKSFIHNKVKKKISAQQKPNYIPTLQKIEEETRKIKDSMTEDELEENYMGPKKRVPVAPLDGGYAKSRCGIVRVKTIGGD